MNNIYSSIYDITNENILLSGKEFAVPKEAFMELCIMHPQNADIYILSKEENNKLFMEKSYIRLLKRLADDRAYENWSGRFNMQCDEFQRLMTMTLVTSAEFAKTDVKAFNNFYSQHNQYGGRLSKSKMAIDVKKSEFKIKMYNSLRKVYNKLPEGAKRFLRKTLKRWRNI